MKLAGLVKTSLIDYPGKIAAVVFTQGCNFRCGFCHNPDLIPGTGENQVSEIEFFQFLASREGVLEGVVITGGEPTIQADLPQFIQKIKEFGYFVKLDSNGSNPKMLKDLINAKLVDFLAMDIKGPLDSYDKISHFSDEKNIEESIKLIMESGLDYEFRTTVLPFFHQISDFEKVGEMINGAKRYAIQGFRPEVTFDKTLRDAIPFNNEELEKIATIMRRYVKDVAIRNNAK
jgi:pyruvate formate lyase activating enzyme